jgi:aspartyl-tRNA(Asn)/glutamyl-tRNA(Gln) amidotransferase subunit C
MSEPDTALVLRIGALARLEIGRDEARALGADFARILERFESLAELDLGDPAPARADDVLAHDAPRDVLREDRPAQPFPSEDLLARAPRRAGDFYAVPKTVDAPGDARGAQR